MPYLETSNPARKSTEATSVLDIPLSCDPYHITYIETAIRTWVFFAFQISLYYQNLRNVLFK
jgi:hypothetical protein